MGKGHAKDRHLVFAYTAGRLHPNYNNNSWRWVAPEKLALKILNKCDKYMIEKKDQSTICKEMAHMKTLNQRQNQWSPDDSIKLSTYKEYLYTTLKDMHN